MLETTFIPWTRETLAPSWPEMWRSSVLLSFTAFQVVILWYAVPLFSLQKRRQSDISYPFTLQTDSSSPLWWLLFPFSRQVIYTEYVLWTSDRQVPQWSGKTSETLDIILSFRGHPSLLTTKIGQKYCKNRPLSWGFGISAPVWGQKCLKNWERSQLRGRLKEILVLIGEET